MKRIEFLDSVDRALRRLEVPCASQIIILRIRVALDRVEEGD